MAAAARMAPPASAGQSTGGRAPGESPAPLEAAALVVTLHRNSPVPRTTQGFPLRPRAAPSRRAWLIKHVPDHRGKHRYVIRLCDHPPEAVLAEVRHGQVA